MILRPHEVSVFDVSRVLLQVTMYQGGSSYTLKAVLKVVLCRTQKHKFSR